MKLIELIDARDSLQKLIMQDLPIRKAYELMRATEEINKHLGFYGSELAKLGPIPDMVKVKELEDLEIPDLEKTQIVMEDSLRLSASDVALLMPIIEFI